MCNEVEFDQPILDCDSCSDLSFNDDNNIDDLRFSKIKMKNSIFKREIQFKNVISSEYVYLENVKWDGLISRYPKLEIITKELIFYSVSNEIIMGILTQIIYSSPPLIKILIANYSPNYILDFEVDIYGIFTKLENFEMIISNENLNKMKISSKLFYEMKNIRIVHLQSHNGMDIVKDSFLIDNVNDRVGMTIINNSITEEQLMLANPWNEKGGLFLNLKNNFIKSLPEQLFSKYCQGNNLLDLDGNLIMCSCNYSSWIFQTNCSEYIKNIKCENYNNISLYDLGENGLCNVPIPTIRPTLENNIIPSSKSLTWLYFTIVSFIIILIFLMVTLAQKCKPKSANINVKNSITRSQQENCVINENTSSFSFASRPLPPIPCDVSISSEYHDGYSNFNHTYNDIYEPVYSEFVVINSKFIHDSN